MIARATADPPSRLGWVGPARRTWFRHPERTLAGVALLAWGLVLVQVAGHRHGSWLQAQATWLTMVGAMMIPPALPMARHVALNSKRQRRQRGAFLFVGASLLPWVAVGLVLVTLSGPAGLSEYRQMVLGVSLLLAAAWELTSAKKRALKKCHRTIPLPAHGRKADIACVKLGLNYGRACFGACWALMLPMALLGHLSVTLMLVMTGIAVAEEVVRKGYRLAPAAAVLLTVAGTMVLVLG